MRLLVITGDHGRPDPTKWDGAYAEGDLELHRAMCDALATIDGYEVEVLTAHARLADRMLLDPPELVLNFCDTGFDNVATQELLVPALCELHGVPYTGAPPAGMVLCYDKAIVRAIADSHRVPVPEELYLPADAPLDDLHAPWPVLIKPAQGDGSEGIRSDAVVHDADAARRYLEWFRGALPGRAALLQEFLGGAEYGLALIGNPGHGFTALPPLELDYGALDDGQSPILAFESKTGPANPYDAVRVVPAAIDPDTLARMRRDAELLFGRLQCRDYARFDFRTDSQGRVKLLEVNPNPAWSREGKLARMAAFGGMSYPELLASILKTARTRIGR